MVDICQAFVSSKNLKFGTHPNPNKSKTKCIVFTKKHVDLDQLMRIELNGNILPWVKTVKHLGHTLQMDNSMKLDITYKKGSFIGRTNSLLQEFGNVSHKVLLKVLCSFATNLYGSNLWDLFGPDCERVYTSYNVAIRNALKIDRRTHRNLIEPLSDIPHLKTLFASRFLRFHNSLRSSSKFPVRFLARLHENDLRTVHGRNIDEILRQCNIESRSPTEVKPKLSKTTSVIKFFPLIKDGELTLVESC